MEQYIIISEDFYNQYQGYKKDENIFNAVWNNNGDYVCALNSVNVFSEIFENYNLVESNEITSNMNSIKSTFNDISNDTYSDTSETIEYIDTFTITTLEVDDFPQAESI